MSRALRAGVEPRPRGRACFLHGPQATFVHRVCEARRAGSGGGRCDAGAAARCPAGARPI